ncbi:antifreeze protein [Falsirhodobacter xinxiangensis]|uniref:antifreeze protein n=1 Tax=Falsirhodobacter xinxiangensis TaxID=2530049 RepID=UPI001FEC5FA1|nr:antifreeze protein [Rhodobacter xinxiangensis]
MMNPWFQTAMMMVEAQQVIALRMMGMAGICRPAPTENTRMVTEKFAAAMAAQQAAWLAMMTGRSPYAAALKPVRAKTRANAARLTKAALKR